MLRQRLSTWLWLAFFVALFGLLGCGGGGKVSQQAQVQLKIADDQAGRTLPPGTKTTLALTVVGADTKPLANQEIVLVAPPTGSSGAFTSPAPEGAHVFRGRTDSTGKLTAELTLNGQTGVFLISAQVAGISADFTFAITSTTQPVPALSSTVARAAMRTRLLGGKSEGEELLLHGPVLLPAGTALSAAGDNADGTPGLRQTLAKTSWLFWLDEAPTRGFAHRTKFALLDAADASIGFESRAQVLEAYWWPNVTLNGVTRPLYPAAQAFDALPPGTRLVSSDAGASSRAPNDTCAILVHGPDAHKSFSNDVERWRSWLTQNPGRVNANRIFPNAASPPTSNQDLDGYIQQAKDAGCKKIYYISVSHGSPGKCRLRGPNDPAGQNEALGEDVSYDSIAQRLGQTNAEICAVIWACYAGQAVGAFQNRGVAGQIVTASTNEQAHFRYHDTNTTDNFCPWNEALRQCANDPTADGILPGSTKDNKVDLLEAEAWVRQNPGKTNPYSLTRDSTYAGWVLQGGSRASTLQNQPEAYPLGALRFVKKGDVLSPVIGYPPGVTADRTLTVTVRVQNDAKLIAAFGGSSVETFTLIGGATHTLAIRAYDDGETTYSIQARTDDGRLFTATAPVQVGSSITANPASLKVVVGQTSASVIQLAGVLGTLNPPIGVAATARNASLITVLTPVLTFPGTPTSSIPQPIQLRAGFTIGNTIIDLNDATHGITGTLPVEVVQEVSLGVDLRDPTTNQVVFAAGTKITTDRITGYTIASPDLCDGWHLHGAAITIDGKGPFPDPRSGGCGYGLVIQPQ